jgi:hypothetical protein
MVVEAVNEPREVTVVADSPYFKDPSLDYRITSINKGRDGRVVFDVTIPDDMDMKMAVEELQRALRHLGVAM